MTVRYTLPGSIARELDICDGDELLRINGQPVRDCIDYAYHMAETELVLLLRDGEGEYEAEVHKQPYEDIGITFEQDGLRGKKMCGNRCVFCFVDQLPRGLRKTLYVKDDDWRLSFLMGNYVTLTNLSEPEIARILEQKISPLYVSVHASDDSVRARLLQNERGRHSFDILRRLVRGGIRVHTQVVVCEGINDGQVLRQTLDDLYALHPGVRSVAVIPVGLTQHRAGLCPLRPVSRKNARAIIDLVQGLQREYLQAVGSRFVFASDEMYIRAEMPLPEYAAYEDFPQIENGVGLVIQFLREAREAIQAYAGRAAHTQSFAVATGVDFYPYMCGLAREIEQAFGARIHVYSVNNTLFGESVTVTGLLSGADIAGQLHPTEDILLLSRACFREQTECMLDGVTLDELVERLGVACRIVDVDGYAFVQSFIMGE